MSAVERAQPLLGLYGPPPRAQARPPRPVRTGRGGASTWPELLDALEERNRRVQALLDGTTDDLDLPEPSLDADGPLPAELELRARVLLTQTEQLRTAAENRQSLVRRALRYSLA